MNLTLLIGIVAGVLTTVAFIPQVVKTWRSRSSGDLSLGMFGMMVTGVIFRGRLEAAVGRIDGGLLLAGK